MPLRSPEVGTGLRETRGDTNGALDREWFLTNGLGGFAAQTALGLNARRYHGLLIAALNPPTDRRLLLAKVDEEIEGSDGVYLLGTNRYEGAVHPTGYRYLDRFTLSPLPTFVFTFGGHSLEKTIYMVHGRNAVAVRYTHLGGRGPLRLRLLPLVNCRDYHHTLRANDWPFHQEVTTPGVTVEAYPGAPRLQMAVRAAAKVEYRAGGVWYYSFDYPLEAERGLDHIEDHFQTGVFEVWLSPGDEATFTAEAVEPARPGAPHPQGNLAVHSPETELTRLAQLEDHAGFRAPLLRTLVRAADAFIVNRRSTGAKTVIAGYPWFTDWGRDTMIALPGLTLVTGRFEDARSILATFAQYERDGLLPNNFPDVGEEPAYHTVDAALWFVNAVYAYWRYAGDEEFVAERLFPVVRSVIRHYGNGTRFNIHMDVDGLIWAGEPGWALTWMDAKVGDFVVTPRIGKPVEINALWYNALEAAAVLARRVVGDEAEARAYEGLASRTARSFRERFWNPERGCLYDVLDTPPEVRPDPSVRPNQIFAVSLPFAPLAGESGCEDLAALVVARVEEELLTPYGLRSLSPGDPAYRGRYCGDPTCRDCAYHQGTVWGWLLGPFISAFVRVNGSTPETLARGHAFIEPLARHLAEAGLGSVSEIFEGDEPHGPRGCFAQAWSVAELLRAAVEDLGIS